MNRYNEQNTDMLKFIFASEDWWASDRVDGTSAAETVHSGLNPGWVKDCEN